jgi:hypothetical protein
MSRSIWTRCAGRTRAGALDSEPWRVVEAQHVVTTRHLVDTLAEHELLERLLDASKPPVPATPEFEGLHYLLSTPFRYPPLRHGSRFGRRTERALWYGAESVEAALAEVAYYRLVFLDGTKADLQLPTTAEFSAFQARVHAKSGIDLTREPFAGVKALRSKTSYAETQRLGSEMRADGIEAVRYFSARDPGEGTCIALFTPQAFASREPLGPAQNWYCTVGAALAVEFTRQDLVAPRTIQFHRSVFLVGGRLPAPAV